MNMAETAWYKAVPSMLMVAPIGRRKRVMRLSTLLFSSTQRIVMGNVIELWQKQTLVTLWIYQLKLDLEFVVTWTLCPSWWAQLPSFPRQTWTDSSEQWRSRQVRGWWKGVWKIPGAQWERRGQAEGQKNWLITINAKQARVARNMLVNSEKCL